MEFYDYKTLPVNGAQIVDPNKTGMSFYDQFLTDKELDYLHNNKNLDGDIIMMSPEEYYEACAKYGFPNSPVSVDNLKRTRRLSTDTLEHLKEVLLVHKKRFPMPMLNIAEKGQEGLHRMMVIGDLFGWDHKVPVLVVTWYDEDRAKREAEAKHKYDIDYNVEKAIQETCYYTYYSIEEIAQQLQHELFRRFEYRDSVKVPDEIELKETPEGYAFTFEGYEYAIDKEDVELKDEAQDELDDVDVEDLESTEDFLKRYFGDNWRETHPHLKDTFQIDEELTTKTVRRDNPNDFSPFGYKVDFYDGDKHIGEGSVCGIKDDNAFLYDFEVYPEYRGKGYSKEMLQYLIDKYDLKQLYVDQDNTVAINLYKKYGFKVDDEVDDNGKPAYSMLRENKSAAEESFDVDKIKQMDDIIQSRWALETPGEGCIFIAPNGKFINIYPELDDHEDLCYWLEELEDYNFDTPEDAEWFVAEFGYVRCRNSSHLCFIEVPQKMTREQYYSLEQWLEEKVSSDKIDIESWSGEWKTYNLDDYLPEDIIKIIKRSYASGKLYEKLK